jgi:hypothetical protein
MAHVGVSLTNQLGWCEKKWKGELMLRASVHPANKHYLALDSISIMSLPDSIAVKLWAC